MAIASDSLRASIDTFADVRKISAGELKSFNERMAKANDRVNTATWILAVAAVQVLVTAAQVIVALNSEPPVIMVAPATNASPSVP